MALAIARHRQPAYGPPSQPQLTAVSIIMTYRSGGGNLSIPSVIPISPPW